METDGQRLERILNEVKEHQGKTTLHKDINWLYQVQAEGPEWALEVFKRYERLGSPTAGDITFRK